MLSLKVVSGLEEVYAKIPKLDCKRLCQNYCGVIELAEAERTRITESNDGRPYIQTTSRCPVLDRNTGNCKAYSVRPLLCRLFGVTRGMACPHGCQPERWLSDEEAFEMIQRVHEVGGLAVPFRGVFETHMRSELARINSAITAGRKPVGNTRRGLPRKPGFGHR